MDREQQNVELVWRFPENQTTPLNNQVLYFFQQGVNWLFWTFVEKYASFVAFGSLKLKFDRWKKPKNAFPFPNGRLNFLIPGLNKQFCTSRESINIIIPYIGNLKDRNSLPAQSISLFTEFQTFCSPNMLAAFCPSGLLSTFSYW